MQVQDWPSRPESEIKKVSNRQAVGGKQVRNSWVQFSVDKANGQRKRPRQTAALHKKSGYFIGVSDEHVKQLGVGGKNSELSQRWANSAVGNGCWAKGVWWVPELGGRNNKVRGREGGEISG